MFLTSNIIRFILVMWWLITLDINDAHTLNYVSRSAHLSNATVPDNFQRDCGKLRHNRASSVVKLHDLHIQSVTTCSVCVCALMCTTYIHPHILPQSAHLHQHTSIYVHSSNTSIHTHIRTRVYTCVSVYYNMGKYQGNTELSHTDTHTRGQDDTVCVCMSAVLMYACGFCLGVSSDLHAVSPCWQKQSLFCIMFHNRYTKLLF